MEQAYELLYPVASKKFMVEFGGMPLPDKYYSDHPFTQLVNKPLVVTSDVCEGEIALKNRNGEKVDANFEAWTNSYNLFVLIWRKPKIRLPRKRVVFNSKI